MAQYQIGYSPGGIMRVVETFTFTGNYIGQGFASAIPDSAEHDRAKECIEMLKIQLEMTGSLAAQFWTGLSEIKVLMVGFRPGSFAYSNSNMSLRWLNRTIAADRQPAAAVGSHSPDLGFTWNFEDNPIPMDPVVNSFGYDMVTAGASTLVTGQIARAYYEYRWVKSDNTRLNAYLNWEALGA